MHSELFVFIPANSVLGGVMALSEGPDETERVGQGSSHSALHRRPGQLPCSGRLVHGPAVRVVRCGDPGREYPASQIGLVCVRCTLQPAMGEYMDILLCAYSQ